MKLLKLILENFKNISTGMSKNRIEIDWTNTDKVLSMLLGPNGSGKTSIASECHPFASSGDTRTGSLVPDNGTAYKQVDILHDNSMFIVKHHYKNNGTSTTVKSFISKDGVELNPNGNVRSFKDVVEKELEVTEDLLVLMRLGSNMTNLISMSSTKRKKYSVELLKDLDVYGIMYKNCNEHYRQLKTLISDSVRKKDKLNITDINVESDKVMAMNKDRDSKSVYMQNLYTDIEMKKKSIDDIDKEISDYGDIDYKSKIMEIKSNIKSIRNRLDNSDLIVGDIEENIGRVETVINDLNMKLQMNRLKVDEQFNSLNTLYTLKTNLEQSLSCMSDREYSKIQEYKLDLEKKKINLAKRVDGYDKKYTKEYVMKRINVLDNINNMIVDITSNSDLTSVQNVCSMISRNVNVAMYVKSNLSKLDSKISSTNVAIERLKSNGGSNVHIIFTPDSCREKRCPYKMFYDDTTAKSSDSINKLYNELNVLYNKKEAFESEWNIYNSLNKIKSYVLKEKDTLADIPTYKKAVDFQVVMLSISNNIPIYNEDNLVRVLDDIDQYEDYLDICDKIINVNKELDILKDNRDTVENITNSLNDINANIDTKEKDIQKIKDIIDIDVSELDKNEKLLDNIISTRDMILELVENNKDLNKYITDYNHILLLRAKKDKIQRDIVHIGKQYEYVSNQIRILDTDIKQREFNIKSFGELTENIDGYMKEFKKVEIIRESLSSNKGLQVLFVQMYFGGCLDIMNELMDIAFDHIKITSFDINENDFLIPYTRKGVMISDISKTSQGEQSLISVILSLTFMIKACSAYNIIILDEIDAPLDTKNRAIFLEVLNRLIKKIKAQSVIVISHNNNYDNYPANLIFTDKSNMNGNMNNKTIIDIK